MSESFNPRDPRYLLPEQQWQRARDDLRRELVSGEFPRILEWGKQVIDSGGDPDGDNKRDAALGLQDLVFGVEHIIEAVRSLRIEMAQRGLHLEPSSNAENLDASGGSV